ncbi:Hpt domain-containing protein [Massilia cavernae]|uniref:Hpt domain-containing protein n=1 Tax=Massilia cavernae TaxID=2320864 RepID=A0A418XGW9_9BURK|nr:Hpt domain-containing protein [Massilia cavernae]RJG11691.1 Hpt domain-containing protein [Massilia cavernae]
MTEASAAEQFREIIDVNEGVERVMGDRDLYARMLRRFRKDYINGDQPIRAALNDGEAGLAHRLSHTIKGAAGMIGARRLHQHAADLETALRTGNGSESANLEKLAPALADVLWAIDGILDDAPGVPPHLLPGGQPMADPAVLTHLLNLLANGDGAAIDLLEEFEATLRAILGDSRFGEVSGAANEFDYESALSALRRQPGGF